MMRGVPKDDDDDEDIFGNVEDDDDDSPRLNRESEWLLDTL